MVTLEGQKPPPVSLSSISAKQMFKSIQGNDVWAYVLVDNPITKSSPQLSPDTSKDIQDMLMQYADFFRILNSYHHIGLMTMLYHCILMRSRSMPNPIIILPNIKQR